jgi:hypothetical protein
VSPNLNSLESLFDKEGLREFGDSGLKRLDQRSSDMPSRINGDSSEPGNLGIVKSVVDATARSLRLPWQSWSQPCWHP